jgi:hypothetical protein
MESMAYVGAAIGILVGVTGSVIGILGARAGRGRDTGQLRAVLRVASAVCLILAVGGGITRLAVPTETVSQLAELLWFVGAVGLSVMAFISFSHAGGRVPTHYMAIALVSGVLLLAFGVHNYSTGEDWGRAVRELIWGGILLINSSVFLFVARRIIGGNPVK